MGLASFNRMRMQEKAKDETKQVDKVKQEQQEKKVVEVKPSYKKETYKK